MMVEVSAVKKEDKAAYELALGRFADHLERVAGPPVDGDLPMSKWMKFFQGLCGIQILMTMDSENDLRWFLSTLPYFEPVTTCSACRAQGPTMRCQGCKVVRYCSPACQKANWKAHKILCRSWLSQGKYFIRKYDEKSCSWYQTGL